MQLEELIEAILFTATRPLTSAEIAALVRKGSTEEEAPFAKTKEPQVEEILQGIKARRAETPLILQEINHGWLFGTHPKFAPWVGQVSEESRSTRLTQAALETLAVIAYRQPVSRAEIESVRGVAVGGVLETLVERDIICVSGRAEAPGRPWLYATTTNFLEHFGIRDLSELPNNEELRRVKIPVTTPADPSEQPELIHESPETPQQN